jgi:hypothetical protein
VSSHPRIRATLLTATLGLLAMVAWTAIAAASSAKLTLTSTSASATDVSYTASFTAVNATTTSQTITFTGPTGTDFNECAGSCFVTDTTTGIGDYASYVSGTGDTLTIQVPTSFNIADSVVVTINGVTNTSTPGSAQPFTVQSGTDPTQNFTEDITSPTHVTSQTLALTSTSAGATDVSDTFSFTATNGLTGNYGGGVASPSTFTVTGPPGTNFNACTGDCLMKDVTTGSEYYSGYVSGTGDTLTFSDPEDVSVTNPASENTTAGFSIATSSDPTPVSFTEDITPPTEVGAAILNSTSTSAGATDVSDTFSFTAANGLTSNGSHVGANYGAGVNGYSTFTVTGPPGTNFNACTGDCLMKDVTTGSEYYSGYVSGTGDTLTFSDPEDVSAGDTVEVTIDGVTNPASENTTAGFSIATSSDPTPVSFTEDITPPTGIGSPVLTTTPTYAGPANTAFTYTASFVATNGLTGGDSHLGANYGAGVNSPSTITLTAPSGTDLTTSADPCNGTCYITDTTTGQGYYAAYVSGTGNTLTILDPRDANVGDQVQVVLSAVTDTSAPSPPSVSISTSSDPLAVPFAAPLAKPVLTGAAPTISGSPAVGSTLTCNTSLAEWSGTPTFTYEFLSNGYVISGPAAGSTYIVTSGDAGSTITCEAIATNTKGTTDAAASNSLSVPVPTVAPINTGTAPSISGTPAVGQTLICEHGTWTGSPTFTYEFLRDNVSIAGFGIPSTYVVTTADQGHTLSCAVTATNSAGGREASSSNSLSIPSSSTTTTTPASTTTTPTTTTPAGVPVSTAVPVITGIAKAGSTLSCSNASWNNSPTKFSYQWARDGTQLAGSTASTYTVQALDEGSTLTCTVIASNAAGNGSPSTSATTTVPVPRVAGCPAATGALTSTQLGQIKLGMTRQQARHAYPNSTNRSERYEDFFCLTPIGIRVGYGSPKLLKATPRNQRKHLAARVVWASTANPRYAIDTVRPGATLTNAQAKLPRGNLFHIGLNDWYLAPDGTVTAIFKVRSSIIQEVGIAEQQITATRKTQRTFLTSFS